MNFKEFYLRMEQVWPAIDQSLNGRGDKPGITPGFIRIASVWNALAIMFPKQCDDIVYWASNDGIIDSPRLLPNPLKDHPPFTTLEEEALNNPFEKVFQNWDKSQTEAAVVAKGNVWQRVLSQEPEPALSTIELAHQSMVAQANQDTVAQADEVVTPKAKKAKKGQKAKEAPETVPASQAIATEDGRSHNVAE